MRFASNNLPFVFLLLPSDGSCNAFIHVTKILTFLAYLIVQNDNYKALEYIMLLTDPQKTVRCQWI